MKRIILQFVGVCLFSVVLVSCQGVKPMDAAQIQAKADSAYKVQSLTVIESLNKDCKYEMAGKVKTMCDSICNANGMDMGKM